MPTPSCPRSFRPAQPAGQPGPGTRRTQLPRARKVGKGRAAGSSGGSAGSEWQPLSWRAHTLTPAQRSAIGAQPAGVIIAGRDLCKGVAAGDRGGDRAVIDGGVAQPPIGIFTCTTPSRADRATNSSRLPRARMAGQTRAAGTFGGSAGGVWQPRPCAAWLARASLTPAQRSAIREQPAGVLEGGRELFEDVAARDREWEQGIAGGAHSPPGIGTCLKTTKPAGRGTNSSQSPRARMAGQEPGSVHFRRQGWRCVAAAALCHMGGARITHPSTAQCHSCAARRCGIRRPRAA